MSKQRWKGTLPVLGIRPSLLMASQHLVNAMAWSGLGRTAGDRERAAAAAFAAAHIRAYRKSLGVETERCDSLNEGMTPDELLWSAMSHLCYAGLFHDDDEPKYTAYHLRAAEADLRELWKRGHA